MNSERESPLQNNAQHKILEWKVVNEYLGPFVMGGVHEPWDLEKLEMYNEIQFGEVPPLARATEMYGPLVDVELEGTFMPLLMDSIAGALPPDAWDHYSGPIEASQQNDSVDGRTLAESAKDLMVVEKRGAIVWDMYETEKNYTAQLGVLENYYRKKLVQRGYISEHTANMIFFGIPELLQFHLSFSNELEEVVNSWSTTETLIGSLFIKHVQELEKLYSRFIDNYSASQRAIKGLEKDNNEYNQFILEASKSKVDTNRQSLKDSLVFPVQRTTRYHLYLKELVAKTPKDHPDMSNLETAFESVLGLANSVNDKKRKEEEATGLFEAFEQTKNCPPPLISHKRRLILNSDAVCAVSKRNIRLTLCSDLLMIALAEKKTVLNAFARSSGADYTFKFIRWLDVLETDITDLHDTVPNTIRITLSSPPVGSNRPTNTTSPSDISQSAKELASNSFTVQFTGYDASKSRMLFIKAMETVTKSCREEAFS
ncbi:Protein T2 [Boothiomyces macroporosus]|uniref:Protein T2 n=1 Tax=Boothiomyces macroporosus TaxID=261099 RepID=A0AAD5UEC8_9FUNG|nr:Protein T2 [Boothiomyces macroporosus]